MKLYKIKDGSAGIIWFPLLILLQLQKKYKVVTCLLAIGMLMDIIITFSDIGNYDIVI